MRISVKVKCRASQNELMENPDGTFTVYLKTSPIKGQANEALVRLLSEKFDVAKSVIRIVKGTTSKNKIISIGE
jgi:hypothetical protein